MSKNTGGPAFPQTMVDLGGEAGLVASDEMGQGGMTLRDYFAAKAISITLQGASLPTKADRDKWLPIAAGYAYEVADAMLTERDK